MGNRAGGNALKLDMHAAMVQTFRVRIAEAPECGPLAWHEAELPASQPETIDRSLIMDGEWLHRLKARALEEMRCLLIGEAVRTR